MVLQDTYTLNNGVEIPKIGFGTWMIENGLAAEAVREAIAVGYRHIDTAQAYANEAGVGEGLRTSGVSRDLYFVTTKLAAEIKDYAGAGEAINGSLRTMGLDTIDMMIIHSPGPSSGAASISSKGIWRRGALWKRRWQRASCAPSAFRISRRSTSTISLTMPACARRLTRCWRILGRPRST